MSNDSELVSRLARVELFGALPEQSLRRIASQMRGRDFGAGETVVEEQQAGKFGRLYVIMSGTAEVTIDGAAVATYGPGDYFGEMSVLDGKPRTATVTATADLATMGLTSWNMRALLREEPDIAAHVIQTLVARLRDSGAGGQD